MVNPNRKETKWKSSEETIEGNVLSFTLGVSFCAGLHGHVTISAICLSVAISRHVKVWKKLLKGKVLSFTLEVSFFADLHGHVTISAICLSVSNIYLGT